MVRQLSAADAADALADLQITEADEAREAVVELDLSQGSSFQGSRRRVVPRSQVRQGTKPSAYSTPHCCPQKRVVVSICSTMSTPSWSRNHVSWLWWASSIATFVWIVPVTSTNSTGAKPSPITVSM